MTIELMNSLKIEQKTVPDPADERFSQRQSSRDMFECTLRYIYI